MGNSVTSFAVGETGPTPEELEEARRLLEEQRKREEDERLRNEGFEEVDYDPEFMCHNCKKPFLEKDVIVQYGVAKFHESHYQCATCACDLHNAEKVRWFHNKLLCWKPYIEANRAMPKCAACHQILNNPNDASQTVRALGHAFHRKCLKCVDCTDALNMGTGIFHAGRLPHFQPGDPIYCKPCYLYRYQDRCAGCCKTLSGIVTKVDNLIYHIMCFKCRTCKLPLEDKFVKKDYDVYCESCYAQQFAVRRALSVCACCSTRTLVSQLVIHCQNKHNHSSKQPRCNRCKEVITGAYKVVFDKHYHTECFICGTCKKPLQSGKDPDPIIDILLCEEHFYERRAEYMASKLV